MRPLPLRRVRIEQTVQRERFDKYIVRANALEDNYRLYHVVAGNRRQFAGANFKVTSGESHGTFKT